MGGAAIPRFKFIEVGIWIGLFVLTGAGAFAVFAAFRQAL